MMKERVRARRRGIATAGRLENSQGKATDISAAKISMAIRRVRIVPR